MQGMKVCNCYSYPEAKCKIKQKKKITNSGLFTKYSAVSTTEVNMDLCINSR